MFLDPILILYNLSILVSVIAHVAHRSEAKLITTGKTFYPIFSLIYNLSILAEEIKNCMKSYSSSKSSVTDDNFLRHSLLIY